MKSTIDDIADFAKYKNKLLNDLRGLDLNELFDVGWASHTFKTPKEKPAALVIVGDPHAKVEAAWKTTPKRKFGQLRRVDTNTWEVADDALDTALKKIDVKTIVKVKELKPIPAAAAKPAAAAAVTKTEKPEKAEKPVPGKAEKVSAPSKPAAEKWILEWDKQLADTLAQLNKLPDSSALAALVEWTEGNYPYEFKGVNKDNYKPKLEYLERAVLKKAKDTLRPPGILPKTVEPFATLPKLVEALSNPLWLDMESEEIGTQVAKAKSAADLARHSPTRAQWKAFLMPGKEQVYRDTTQKMTIESEICSSHFTVLPKSISDAKVRIVGMAPNDVLKRVFVDGIPISERAHATISNKDNTRNLHLYLGASYQRADSCPEAQSAEAKGKLQLVQAEMVKWLLERIKAFQDQLA